MLKEKIDIEKWSKMLNRFGEINCNRPTRLKVINQFGNLLRGSCMEDGLPLVGIDVDLKGFGSPSIQIMLASKDSNLSHLTHIVTKAKNVVIELNHGGDFECLHIENIEGEKTILHFENK